VTAALRHGVATRVLRGHALQVSPPFVITEAEITTLVDVSAWSPAKRAAMECHRTQRQDFGWLLELPDDLAFRILSPESFVLTRWPYQGIAAGLRETSLFDGLQEG
jgi:LmbE family N-acetylglucosaminyl deacetylase